MNACVEGLLSLREMIVVAMDDPENKECHLMHYRERLAILDDVLAEQMDAANGPV